MKEPSLHPQGGSSGVHIAAHTRLLASEGFCEDLCNYSLSSDNSESCIVKKLAKTPEFTMWCRSGSCKYHVACSIYVTENSWNLCSSPEAAFEFTYFCEKGGGCFKTITFESNNFQSLADVKWVMMWGSVSGWHALGDCLCTFVFWIAFISLSSVRAYESRVFRSSRHAARNQFERFRSFLEIQEQIRIRFPSLRIFFLNDANFWCVRGSITHNVAVHVLVLWHVCAHTIVFRMLWCPWRFIITHKCVFIVFRRQNMNVYVYVSVSVPWSCKWFEWGLARWWKRFGKGKRWWRLVVILTFRSFVMPGGRGQHESNNQADCFLQDSWRRTASSGKAND